MNHVPTTDTAPDDLEARLARAGDHLLRRAAEYREAPTLDRAPARRPARPVLRRVLVGSVAAAVLAVAALAVDSGKGSPALAWSPDPEVATPDDEAAARAACTVDDEFAAPEAGRTEGDPAAAAAAVVVSSVPSGPLPPLVSLDLRGTGGMATFADAEWEVTCMLLRDGEGFQRGPMVFQEAGEMPATGGLTLGPMMSTTWSDGTTSIAMMSGVVPPGATTVELLVPGLPTASSVVEEGRFGIWWMGSLVDEGVSVRALDPSGAELASVALADVLSGRQAAG